MTSVLSVAKEIDFATESTENTEIWKNLFNKPIL